VCTSETTISSITPESQHVPALNFDAVFAATYTVVSFRRFPSSRRRLPIISRVRAQSVARSVDLSHAEIFSSKPFDFLVLPCHARLEYYWILDVHERFHDKWIARFSRLVFQSSQEEDIITAVHRHVQIDLNERDFQSLSTFKKMGSTYLVSVVKNWALGY
jgi:hypothetical protein